VEGGNYFLTTRCIGKYGNPVYDRRPDPVLLMRRREPGGAGLFYELFGSREREEREREREQERERRAERVWNH